jgi:o-succinylbenzoate---CoA ligase
MMERPLIPDWLDRRASVQPDHPAVMTDGRSVTYAELARRACAAGGRLVRMGVQHGDRVAVLLQNGLEFVEVMYGLMGCGAVLVPLHSRLTPTEVSREVADCGARLVLARPETLHSVAGMFSAPVSVRAWSLCPAEEAVHRTGTGMRIDLDEVHSVIYTSGTGGPSKGVRLTYGNHWWSTIGSALNLGVHADDRWLACLPFCHVGGLSILLRSVIYGTTAVVHDGFDPARVNGAIDEDRVTIVSLVATMLRRMLTERGEKPYPSWLRCLLVGGGPVPLSLLEECAARNLPVVQTYGLSEAASQVTTLAPGDALRKLGSAGKPLLPTEVEIAGARRPVPVGEIGEILVRGPTMSPGYVGQAEPPTDAEGWLHTGDVGRFDAEGFLHVLGRRDDVIVSGGENVHPVEVEAVLQSHPAVSEVCVVGAPDAEWSAAVVAFVRVREGTTTTEVQLREHARRRLAGFKLPRRIIFVDDFPRTAAGKIARQELRQRLV